ncbi:hypothetical protein BDEG_20390 [Batrachochytrium dendrobatidis JEL423]|uniref:Uncharacterized protein n=1 Tax=Batrachochytrium dendrobatidis (strain JEL423) TaxID=403673 RepID=A0A177W8W6_BATDL|nr:hypothetical protein BDEG_20390 [Batrachochytrium dendrobatidis JEL423]
MHATDHLLLVLIHNIFECRHCPTHDDTLQQLHHLLSSSQSHVDLAHSQSPPKALHILHASDLSPVFMMPNHYFSKNLGLDLSAVLCGPNLLDQFSGSEESQQFQRALNIQSSGSQCQEVLNRKIRRRETRPQQEYSRKGFTQLLRELRVPTAVNMSP